MGADCAPVLFCDPVNKIIGAAHSGWKGALDGASEAVIESMCKLGAEVGLIYAAIGPAMQQPHYEVGKEFKLAFEDYSQVGCQPCFVERGFSLYFDLTRYITLRLRAVGIVHCEHLTEDTYTQPEKYFSYRRARNKGEENYGRQISAICLS